MKIKILAALAALSLGNNSHAQVVNYVEAVSGDLSGNGAAPTVFDFAPGLNTVTGTMGRAQAGGPIDRDIFTFKLEPWEIATSLTVLTFSPLAAPGPIGSFLAISGSTTINITNPSSHLSNILVTGPGEILPLLAAGSYSNTLGTQPPTLGLTAPLGSGDYTIWFQELTTQVNYSLGITVTAVPEPATYAWFGGIGLLLICAIRRVRSESSRVCQ